MATTLANPPPHRRVASGKQKQRLSNEILRWLRRSVSVTTVHKEAANARLANGDNTVATRSFL